MRPEATERNNPSRSGIYSDGSWSREELSRMFSGAFVDRNGKRYAMCQNCRQVVRVDKPLFGSTHFCS